jgi:hypothetical protein
MGKGKVVATNNDGGGAVYEFNLIKQGTNDPAPGQYSFNSQPVSPSLTDCYSCNFTGTSASAQAKSDSLSKCAAADCS